jgi:ABC-2 type transport system ATP-binding protein
LPGSTCGLGSTLLEFSAMAGALIEVRDLSKEYRQGFWLRRVQAVSGISFEVRAGTIFGFLGPNGAGKTTTIKVLMGLIAATGGSAKLFGKDVGDASARQKLGFLPENPYVYPYLTAREFVRLCGRLSGLSNAATRDRADHVLDQLGILYAADRPVGRLSKGMLQRAGLAAALVADPELLVLDEPMSGLDPVGRKEVRDLILSERAEGRTIFFSTHILSDVEMLCDEVAILRKGRVVVRGALSDLLKSSTKRVDVVVVDPESVLEASLSAGTERVQRVRDRVVVSVEGESEVDGVLERALALGLRVVEVVPRHETLEDLFVREAIDARRADADATADG